MATHELPSPRTEALCSAPVPKIRLEQIEVHLFRRRGARVEFLILRRSARGRLPGVWQPITGGLRRGESVLAGAAREVFEETGLAPRLWWAIESPTVYFDPAADVVQVLPVLAAEVDAEARVRLSAEHDSFQFVSAAQAARRFLWRQQRVALAAVRREVLAGGRLTRALEVTGRMPRANARRRTATKTHHSR